MKLLKITGFEAAPVTAVTVSNKKNGLYFNTRHGSNGENFWVHVCSINANYFKPTSLTDTLVMDGDDYILKPIKVNKRILKDRRDNTLYIVSKDHMSHHKKDIVVFWEIPNKNYTDVTYSISGMVEMLGEGISGKERGQLLYASPAPVLEIYGDCILKWSGTMPDGSTISQEISFDSKCGSFIFGSQDITPNNIKESEDVNN